MEGRLLTERDGAAAPAAAPSWEGPDHDEPILRVRSITKTFPGTRALDKVDLDLHAGRITALVGHNGSGKSTLVKILSGLYRPDTDDGTIVGTAGASEWRSTLHFIHQDLGLVDMLSTLENLDLSRSISWDGLRPTHRGHERRAATALMADFDVDFDVTAAVRELSPAQRTIVAIARALSGWTTNRQVLILDEPTAALQDREADVLLDVIRRIAARGAAVLFISHRLAEVERIADEAVVLRDGRVIAVRPKGEFTASSLVELIAGTHLSDSAAATPKSEDGSSRRCLSVENLTAAHLQGVDVAVGSGEIVGISGVIGSGIEDLLGTIFGALPRTTGRVVVDGYDVPAGSPHRSIAQGVGFVPRDRHRHGAVLTFSARENLTLPRLRPLRRAWGSIDLARERQESRSVFASADVRPAIPERTFSLFSGGNQQKIVLSKWLRNNPRVLLLEEPTQGVDVGAQSAIYELVRTAAAMGAAVLIASSDTKELVTLCHRVLVLSEGRVSCELEGAALREATLVHRTLSPERRHIQKEN